MNNTNISRTSDRPLSYLFALWDGGGIVPPTLAVMSRLKAAGHFVRVMGEPCQEQEIRQAGIEFVPWTSAPGRHEKTPDNDPLRDWEAASPDQLIGLLRDKLFFGPAKLYADDVHAELNRVPTNCLVSSDMLFGPAIAAEAAGIPYVFMSANIFLFPRPGVPPFGIRPRVFAGEQ